MELLTSATLLTILLVSTCLEFSVVIPDPNVGGAVLESARDSSRRETMPKRGKGGKKVKKPKKDKAKKAGSAK